MFGLKFLSPQTVAVRAETDAESLAKGIELLDQKYHSSKYEETQEKDFYCNGCRSWIPVSQFGTHYH